jgi:hypothetical protein
MNAAGAATNPHPNRRPEGTRPSALGEGLSALVQVDLATRSSGIASLPPPLGPKPGEGEAVASVG